MTNKSFEIVANTALKTNYNYTYNRLIETFNTLDQANEELKRITLFDEQDEIFHNIPNCYNHNKEDLLGFAIVEVSEDNYPYEVEYFDYIKAV